MASKRRPPSRQVEPEPEAPGLADDDAVDDTDVDAVQRHATHEVERHDTPVDGIAPVEPELIDFAHLKSGLLQTRDLLMQHPASFLLPVAFFAISALLDTLVASRAWWLAVLLGAVKGVAWGFYAEAVAKLVAPEVPVARMRGPVFGLFIATSMLLGWGAPGVFCWAVLLLVPVVEALLLDAPSASRAGKRVLHVARTLKGTWFLGQLGVLVAFMMSFALLFFLGSAALGDLLGPVLANLLLAPVAHAWATWRALDVQGLTPPETTREA